MKTFLGSLRHVFHMSDTVHQLWCAAILAVIVILAILHHIWREDRKKIRIWRLLCLLPALICGAHALIYLPNIWPYAAAFIMMYALAVFMLILIPFANRKIGYRIAAVIVGLLTAFCGFYSIFNASNLRNFSRKSYTESFRALVKTMDEQYVLKEWKEADFAALEAKYMPMVEEAEKNQILSEFADAVLMFTHELHDGHIGVTLNIDEETVKEEEKTYTSVFKRRDYGMAMVQLDSGEVIAVCTKDAAHEAGIEDGTVGAAEGQMNV